LTKITGWPLYIVAIATSGIAVDGSDGIDSPPARHGSAHALRVCIVSEIVIATTAKVTSRIIPSHAIVREIVTATIAPRPTHHKTIIWYIPLHLKPSRYDCMRRLLALLDS
jgi:hypothetical protein